MPCWRWGGDDRAGDAGRIRSTFAEASQRNMALGLWAAVGSGGAAFGPLVGGMLLEHFYWGSVFLINVPIVLVVIAINAKVVPRQPRAATSR